VPNQEGAGVGWWWGVSKSGRRGAVFVRAIADRVKAANADRRLVAAISYRHHALRLLCNETILLSLSQLARKSNKALWPFAHLLTVRRDATTMAAAGAASSSPASVTSPPTPPRSSKAPGRQRRRKRSGSGIIAVAAAALAAAALAAAAAPTPTATPLTTTSPANAPDVTLGALLSLVDGLYNHQNLSAIDAYCDDEVVVHVELFSFLFCLRARAARQCALRLR
jgi:hypothetical protein